MRTSDSKKCNPCAREKMLPMYRELQKTPYPNGVVADRTRRSNNAYSVEKTGTTSTQGSSLRIATLGYSQ